MKRKAFAVILAVCIVAICAIGMSTCRKPAGNIEEVLAAAQQYILEGNYEEAIAAFNKAIEIDPKQPDAYNGLYTAYVENKDYTNAWETVRKGIRETGADPENSPAADTDSPDPLKGLDLLIHNMKAAERMMSNPSRFVLTDESRTVTVDYEYEFDENGYTTLVRATSESGSSETRFTRNSVGIAETIEGDGMLDYKLTQTDTGYLVSYHAGDIYGDMMIEETYDLNGNLLHFSSGDTTETYTYDGNGQRLTRETSLSSGTIITYYEKNQPVREEYSYMLGTPGGQLFNTEEYANRFDEYDRIVQVDVSGVNSETNESYHLSTRNYYYFDTMNN